MENFVRSQKRFLDVIAEEAAHATGAPNGKGEPRPGAEISELAREGAEAFIDAQKKLLDIAAQQMAVQVRVARRTVKAVNPFPPITLADLTRQTVDSFVFAQKALLDAVGRPAQAKTARTARKAPPRKPAAARKRRVPTPVPA
jgi:hypothetical protein